jgi:hypothetical protein
MVSLIRRDTPGFVNPISRLIDRKDKTIDP